MYTVESDDGVLIGCHEPGHYEAGMTLALDVTSSCPGFRGLAGVCSQAATSWPPSVAPL